MWVEGDELVEVQTSTCNLLELILSPDNLNRAYRQVVGNGGFGGVDKMGTSELLPYLKLHRNELLSALKSGKYRPCPVRRVEIRKDNVKKRQLGIPTVVGRFIQQAVSQVLFSLYEPLFSDNSFGFRPPIVVLMMLYIVCRCMVTGGTAIVSPCIWNVSSLR